MSKKRPIYMLTPFVCALLADPREGLHLTPEPAQLPEQLQNTIESALRRGGRGGEGMTGFISSEDGRVYFGATFLLLRWRVLLPTLSLPGSSSTGGAVGTAATTGCGVSSIFRVCL